MKRTIGRKKKQPFISLHSDSVFSCSDVSCEIYIYTAVLNILFIVSRGDSLTCVYIFRLVLFEWFATRVYVFFTGRVLVGYLCLLN